MKKDVAVCAFDLERPDFDFLQKFGVSHKEIAWDGVLVYILFYTGRMPSKSTIMKLLKDNGFEIGTTYGEIYI